MKKILLRFTLLFILLFSTGCSNSNQTAKFWSSEGNKVAELTVWRYSFLQFTSLQSETNTFGMTANVKGESKPDTETVDVLLNSDLVGIIKTLIGEI